MFVKRVIGALTFKRAANAEVKKDNSFTSTSWGIVVVLVLITQLIFNYDSFANKPIQILIGGAGYIAGFVFLAFGSSWLGKTLFKADVSFADMVRTLGLASIWVFVFFAFGLLTISILFILGPQYGDLLFGLGCLFYPIYIALFGSYFIAAQAALGLDGGKTLITILLSWVMPPAVTLCTLAVYAFSINH
jgi:hypothetical protein